MESYARHPRPDKPGKEAANRLPLLRSAVLFLNFFLIVTALYHLKPASRSLILESHGSTILPYVWIGSALTLFIAISIYHRLLENYRRLHLVLGTAGFFILLLIAFWLLLSTSLPAASIAFYIFVDIFGVVLVEQLWSLANSIYSTGDGKRWYGLLGTGGLLGGVAGGTIAALLIRHTPLQTPDLLLAAATILAFIIGLTWLMARLQMYREQPAALQSSTAYGGWRHLTRSRYLLLIAGLLLLAQLVSPLVEYEFMQMVETSYPEREMRTATLSLFFTALSAVAIAVNLILTPLVLRYWGVMAGLMVQPLVLMISTLGFMLQPGFLSAATMKISDRGLSYSINRASRELLYIPIDPVVIYQAKAWIDMFGYRIFKVLGSLLILLMTPFALPGSDHAGLTWAIIGGCLAWIVLIFYVQRDYSLIALHPRMAASEHDGVSNT